MCIKNGLLWEYVHINEPQPQSRPVLLALFNRKCFGCTKLR